MKNLKWPGISFLLTALLVVPALPASAEGGNKHLCLPAKHKTCEVVSYDSASRMLTFTTQSHTSTATVGQTSTATTPQTGTATLPVSEDVVVKLSRGKGPKHHLARAKHDKPGKGKHDKPGKSKHGKGSGKHSEGRNPTRGSTDDLQPGATILKLKVRDGVIERIRLRVARPGTDDGEQEADGDTHQEDVEQEEDGS